MLDLISYVSTRDGYNTARRAMVRNSLVVALSDSVLRIIHV